MTQKVSATYRDGRVVMDEVVDWPDGTRIEIAPIRMPASAEDELVALRCALNDPNSLGLDDSLWPETPEGIALLLAHMDAAQPIELSAEEQQSIEDQRAANRQLQKELMRDSWSEMEKLF